MVDLWTVQYRQRHLKQDRTFGGGNGAHAKVKGKTSRGQKGKTPKTDGEFMMHFHILFPSTSELYPLYPKNQLTYTLNIFKKLRVYLEITGIAYGLMQLDKFPRG